MAKLQFMEWGLSKLIQEYTYEAGVRNLEREIGNICRKVAQEKSRKESSSSSDLT